MNNLKDKTNKFSNKSGLVKTIILIVIALIILGYFGFDVENIIKSEKVQKNLNYVWGIISNIWNLYLKAPFVFVWDKFFIGVVWKTIVSVLN